MSKFDLYQQYIHKSRYARYIESKNRREHWEETVDRYINYMQSHVLEKYHYENEELFRELRNAIYNMEVMPSMRAMMTAGKALDRDNTAGYNCLSGEEFFITKNGNVRLMDAVGQALEVLTNDGWKQAEVKSFGVQKLQRITFRPCASKSNIRKTIDATANHRWVTLGRGVVTDLKVGDAVPSSVVSSSKLIPEAFIAGFGFGDGTIDSRGRARIRLCGEKDLQWKKVFEEYGHCSVWHPENMNGDALVVFHVGHFENWKTLPYDKVNDINWISSWLQGYLAADGHSDPRQPGLSSQNLSAIEFVESIAPLCGYVVTGKNISSVMETNLGTRKSPLVRLTLRNETEWYVTTIEELDEQEVFCVVEPETKTFTLSCGMLTGNCSYLPVDDPKAFDEAMHILMCGTGVGFSVERQYINKLPEIPDQLFESDTLIRVKDSKEGWSKALRQLIALLYTGEVPKWDLSQLRPEGAPLKTFGGRASGPAPLDDLFKFVTKTFRGAVGRKLTSIECHDIMCKIGEVVVVGGVRRSAMISLSNLSDDRMRNAKSGAWWEAYGHRALSNNSAVYSERPEVGAFMQEWHSIYESKSGERGIFNREASQKVAGKNGRRATNHEFGTNPCSEIILRPYQFCNLTEVVVRSDDTEESLARKVRLATILGTFQSTLTDFPYLRKIWKKNTEEERLLGVSLTGLYDSKLLNNYKDRKLGERLEKLRNVAIETNAELAEKLGINQSTAITCIKPSGTVSQLVNAASGIHPRHDPYYFRRVRADNKDPLTKYLTECGISVEPDVTKPGSTSIFTFPIKAPKGAMIRADVSAIDALELWLVYQRHWCEHKPSITVYIKDNEWPIVGAWVWEHFDELSGVSFLPYDGGTYRQAPYETIDHEVYEESLAKMPKSIDWDKLVEYADNVEGVQTLACSSGSCEL